MMQTCKVNKNARMLTCVLLTCARKPYPHQRKISVTIFTEFQTEMNPPQDMDVDPDFVPETVSQGSSPGRSETSRAGTPFLR